jgi:hypothetical protein
MNLIDSEEAVPEVSSGGSESDDSGHSGQVSKITRRVDEENALNMELSMNKALKSGKPRSYGLLGFPE